MKGQDNGMPEVPAKGMKTKLDDLAVFGGVPLFDVPLHVGRPNIGNRTRLNARLDDILDRKWLTNDGPYVKEFERRVAEIAGVDHCVALCNGTIALETVFKAMELKGEVILPSFTFIATAHALWWQNVTPVFCDIDPHTHNIDPRKVEQLITDKTSAIVGVHVWGRTCDVEPLAEIARRRGLKLLFDSAHAFGCSHRKTMVGGFGDAEVFSFHATKFVNSLEGGAVVTHDAQLAHRLRSMRNFGFFDYDRTDIVGTNAKMNEMSAAVGLTNIESLGDFANVNYQNYREYRDRLAMLDGVSVLAYDEEEKNNYQYIVLEIDEKRAPVSRDRLVEILHAENVLVRRYFFPGCHRMEPYRSLFAFAEGSLVHTENVAGRVLCLPTGTAIGKDELTAICELLRFVIQHGRDISSRS
jgi:dTDP-4-amino-4,6-dideoxygalactose transaminase